MKQLLKVATILKSKDGEPGYPEAITVLDYSKSGDKYEDISGEYNLVPGEIMEGKPVFIRRGSKASLQFSGPIILIFFMYYLLLYIIQGFQWKISSGNDNKTYTNVYGWEFSDSTTVWPQIENLFIVGNIVNRKGMSSGTFPLSLRLSGEDFVKRQWARVQQVPLQDGRVHHGGRTGADRETRVAARHQEDLLVLRFGALKILWK